MQSKAVFLLSTACIFVSAETAGAQIVYNTMQFPSRYSLGGDFAIFQPKGAFAENVPNGYGFDVTGLLKIDPKGWFNLRADGGGVRYGHEHIGLGFFGPGIELNLDTNNQIMFGALGLQLRSEERRVGKECRWRG